MEKKFRLFLFSSMFGTTGVVVMGIFSFLGSISGGSDYLSYASYAFAVQCVFSIISLGFLARAAFEKGKV